MEKGLIRKKEGPISGADCRIIVNRLGPLAVRITTILLPGYITTSLDSTSTSEETAAARLFSQSIELPKIENRYQADPNPDAIKPRHGRTVS